MGSIDQEKLRIPAFLRKKAIVRQSRQRLILTALDRKQAGLSVHSQKAMAPLKGTAPLHRTASVRMKNVRTEEKPSAGINLFPDEEVKPKYQAPSGFAKIIPVGTVTAYYEKIQVAVILLNTALRIGDLIQIASDGMLFQQPVDSMEINRKPVKMAKKGSDIGLKVVMKPLINGTVYKVHC